MRITTLGAAVAIVGLAMSGAYAQSQTSPQAPAQAGAGGQNAAFCLESSTGAKNCSYATMAACNSAKAGSNDKCAANPAATTGSGARSGSQPMTSPSR